MDNLWLMVNSYPLVMIQNSYLKWPIETDDFPIETSIYSFISRIFHRYVSLPEGNIP